MQLVFVHGWSVTDTSTYAQLPQALSAGAQTYGLDLDIQHLYLGRYISFHDEVTLDDISRAMDRALRELPGNSDTHIGQFACITHSTGGPVVRNWLNRYYGANGLADSPLSHLIMLAPANHGSSLAKLGKARVGRIKAWMSGVEPGQRVLDWLALGSDGQWSLNEQFLEYDYAANNFYPFVLTGQGIDHTFYDFLNSYLVEAGSDGVVRVAGANMNYRYFALKQDIAQKVPGTKSFPLLPIQGVRTPQPVAIGVYKDYSHSGDKMGIMNSIKAGDTNKPVVVDILKCLKVSNAATYQTRAQELADQTKAEQAGNDHYSMLVFNVHDNQGQPLKENDYDVFMLAGNEYAAQGLPKGFFKDRQMNDKTGRLIYYLNTDKMKDIKDGKFGLRIEARPDKGFSYYCPAEFRSDGIPAENIFQPNETTYVDVTLHRFVDENVFRFDPANNPMGSFKKIKPSGKPINNE